jgi:hypothetical protein
MNQSHELPPRKKGLKGPYFGGPDFTKIFAIGEFVFRGFPIKSFFARLQASLFNIDTNAARFEPHETPSIKKQKLYDEGWVPPDRDPLRVCRGLAAGTNLPLGNMGFHDVGGLR